MSSLDGMMLKSANGPIKAITTAFRLHVNDVVAESTNAFQEFPSPWGSADGVGGDDLLLAAISSDDFLALNLTQVNLTLLINASDLNETTGAVGGDALADLILMGVVSVLLGLMILVTVIGNVFVIAAILLERHLQNVANYLIVSLAVADLMVACLVMPLGAVYVISNNWIMGPEVCDMWTTIDVMCCTASILHLVAIAMDRYWAVTNVVYTRNSQRIIVMIVMIWSAALVVSLAPQIPQFGWKDPDYLTRINVKKQCLVSQDVGYQIFATSSTFYVPLLVICILYWQIFQTARKRIRKRREMRSRNVTKAAAATNNNGGGGGGGGGGFLGKRRFRRSSPPPKTALVMVEGQSTATTNTTMEEAGSDAVTAFTISQPSNNVSPEHVPAPAPPQPPPPAPVSAAKDRKETLEAKRERKAAKTLAIITGAFVICWLPFFILALVMPLCGEQCSISPYVISFSLWLGYFNSTLNPVIYTIFNPEFRQAFKRILCGRHGGHRRRHFRPPPIG